MSGAKTLLELAGADLTPAKVRDASLVLIDYQNEYLKGPLALSNPEPAIANAVRLLKAARAAGSPIFHIAHKGKAGSLFDRDAERGQIVPALAPLAGEPVVEKGLPNAFAGTDLQTRLNTAGRKNVIFVGFMTHMCISASARCALDLGFRNTIDASACGTRDLPDGKGGVIPAQTVHEVALVELSDRFALIAQSTDALL